MRLDVTALAASVVFQLGSNRGCYSSASGFRCNEPQKVVACHHPDRYAIAYDGDMVDVVSKHESRNSSTGESSTAVITSVCMTSSAVVVRACWRARSVSSGSVDCVNICSNSSME